MTTRLGIDSLFPISGICRAGSYLNTSLPEEKRKIRAVFEALEAAEIRPLPASTLARLGVPLHVGKLWAELQQAAYEQGMAELDSTAFIEVLRGKAGKAGMARRT